MLYNRPTTALKNADSNLAPSAAGIGEFERIVHTLAGHRMLIDSRNGDVGYCVAKDGYYEAWVEAVLRRLLKPGQTAVEVGANLGYHTLVMAEMLGPLGKLYSFEANPYLARLLDKTIRMNKLEDRIELHGVAVSDRAGEVAFDFHPATPGGGHVTVGGLGPQERRVTVPSVSLDDQLRGLSPIHLLRMDTEGHEVRILEGAWDLIDQSPALAIVTEWNPSFMQSHHQGGVPRLIEALATRGFRAWNIDSGSAQLRPIAMPSLAAEQHSDIVLCRQDVAAG